MQKIHWQSIKLSIKSKSVFCIVLSIELFIHKFDEALAMQQLKQWLFRFSWGAGNTEVEVGDSYARQSPCGLHEILWRDNNNLRTLTQCMISWRNSKTSTKVRPGSRNPCYFTFSDTSMLHNTISSLVTHPHSVRR